ncbi:alpha/beta hydrolase [Sporolactobacillus sp. Y61]|uniref:Alpha/beta hydrolase n=1 Tax=Sporolactobacillus sp. Y61 TaxID=3160863 RepID=A0AAU8IIF6_9BACL
MVVNTQIKITNDQDLVYLSGFTVYQHPEVRKELKVNGNRYYVVNRTYDDPARHGLDAITVKDLQTGDVSIIYEGTQSEQGNLDLKTDIDLALNDSVTEQFKQAEVYYKEMEAIYGDIDHVAGNSLGGGLANYVAVRQDVHSVTLDPAMLPEDVADKYAVGKTNSHITNYYGNYDPLTLAQQAGGYDDRVPGEKVTIDFGVSWLRYLANNHTGYVSDKNGRMNQTITVGIEGTPSYGQIHFMADRQIVSDIWSGKTLTGSTAGSGPKIKLDKSSMSKLVHALDQVILADFQQSARYLDHSVQTIDYEGARLDDRQTEMKNGFERIMRQTAAPIFEEADRITRMHAIVVTTRDEARWIQGSWVTDMAFAGVWSLLGRLADQLYGVDHPLTQVALYRNDLVRTIIEAKYHKTPELLRGGTDEFLDGVVEELKAHYHIVSKNVKRVEQQITGFRNQVEQTLQAMDQADQSIAQALSQGSPLKASAHVEKTVSGNLESSHYLKQGMAIRREILEQNYQAFAQSVNARVGSLLAGLGFAVQFICGAIRAAIHEIRRCEGIAAFVHIPFTDLDHRIRRFLDNSGDDMQRLLHRTENLQEVLHYTQKNLPEILHAFKPYIEAALFGGTQYQAVIAYNHVALGILQNIRLQFKEVAWQLNQNESQAITTLSLNAQSIEHDLDTLVEQVRRGTWI